MLRDVFYYGSKPNAHPREQFAENLEDARQKCTTEHFWIINEFCDYRNFDWDFDFEFLPDEDVWAEDHNNVWPSQHQKDSGTWLCSKEHSDLIIYRGDVDPVKRKNVKTSNWTLLDRIDESKFDFSWHPDPTDPPYIYKWGCKFFPAELKHVLEYTVPGATQEKYMSTIAELLSNEDCWVEYDLVDKHKFDMSWRPSPMDPPFIYVWGNKYVDGKLKPTLEYHTPGATDKKYMPDPVAVLPEWDKWVEIQEVDKKNFDFTWRPDPREPAYIYTWGNKYIKAEDRPTLEYHCDGATDRKYMEENVPVLPEWDRWKILEKIDMDSFDFAWRPDPKEPPFTYVFGNELYDSVKMPTVMYTMPEGPEIKYLDTHKAKLASDSSKYQHLEDSYLSDYSWRPDPDSPPYIYVWGNQWNKPEDKISIQYVVEGATEYKYMTERATRRPCVDNWAIPDNVDVTGFDLSWEPSPKDPAYIYEFATVWNNRGGPRYVVEGATEFKYIEDVAAKTKPVMTNWQVPDKLDVSAFDFSWVPHPDDPAYIYEFGTQWQINGGPKYIVEGATEVKYVDIQKAIKLPSNENWKVLGNIAAGGFDFSWHPDNNSPPYVYVFGNQWNNAFDEPTVEYHAPGATQLKYIEDIVATVDSDKTHWVIPDNVDTSGFDFSWRPNPHSPPYIYEFGTQWQKTGGPRYVVEGAETTKYEDLQKARILPNNKNFVAMNNMKVASFDYSWHPDSTEEPYIYVFGNQWFSAEKDPTLEYRMPGATEKKYINDIVATLDKDMTNWEVPNNIDIPSFDFSWYPDPDSPPYIYEFATIWNDRGGPKYIVPGATEYKYIEDIKAKTKVDMSNWKVPDNIDTASFDFSWVPHPDSPAYIYEFATVWNDRGGPQYVVKDATEYKYVTDIKARTIATKKNWEIPDNIDTKSFDFSWVPHPDSPPYIYEFATVWNDRGGPKYIVPNATEYKYVEDIKAKTLPSKKNWDVPANIDLRSFDFSWVPHPDSPAYIYEFATIWNDRGGPKYVVPEATEYKYVEDIKARTTQSTINWVIPEGIDTSGFDFSWVPHPKAPPYIYQFGTKLDNNDGPSYITPGNDGEVVYLERVELEDTSEITVGQYYIETTLEDLVNEHPNEIFWAMHKNINYDQFDFGWRPGTVEVAWELNYVHVFGSPESEITQTYFVSANNYLNGETQFKFVDEGSEIDEKYLSELFVKPDMFYVDRGNSDSAARFEALKAKFGNRIQKTRYLNSWVDTINRCVNRGTTDLIWVLNSELDYTSFDFNYYPNPWQMTMVHVFGTQHSHWGTTFMVNREAFPEDTKYIKIIEHLSNLNFVKHIRAKATQCVHDIVLIDHGNTETESVYQTLVKKAGTRTVTKINYQSSYFITIKKIIAQQQAKKENFIWVCSSVCDYTNFDFSYIIDPFSRDNLHVFPSGMQKFGDTFFFDVNKTFEIIVDLEKLEEHHHLNFNQSVKSRRLPEPVIVTSDDTHIVASKNITGFPYVTLITEDNISLDDTAVEPMNLWAPETKNILITSTGGTRIVVPAEVNEYVQTELYEYPYIKRMPKLAKSRPLDIVFVSNGESIADQNYEHLVDSTNGLSNKIHRVDGINDRTKALHAAAESSETPWFFGVPAKLFVNKKFDWNYQADRLQMPKHYIFNALNPVNDLFYGHQSMVLYNKNLVLGNKGVGLDFTLDSPHMSVELNSGTVLGDTDPYSTWRTAFREAVKLKKYSDNGDETAKQRLGIWTTVGKGNYGEWSIKGALDGIEFYNEVNGELIKLRQSYYWDWLKDRFESKY